MKRLILLTVLILASSPLLGYYQIISSFNYRYSENLFDFGSLVDDVEGYPALSLRMWWHTGMGGAYFAGNLGVVFPLYENGKIYYNQFPISKFWRYTLPELERANTGDFSLEARSFYFGYQSKMMETKVGFFPFYLSKLTFYDPIIGISLNIHEQEKGFFTGLGGGRFLNEPVGDSVWLVDVTTSDCGFGFKFPAMSFFSLWSGVKQKDFYGKFYYLQGEGIKNYGFAANFSGKGGRVDIEYSISDSNNSKGDAFYIKGTTGKDFSVFISYLEDSGYDFSLSYGMKQTAYLTLRPLPDAGLIMLPWLRNSIPVAILGAGAKYKKNYFSLKGSFHSYSATGYDLPFHRFIGTEEDIVVTYDLGYFFVNLSGGILKPGLGIRDIINEFVYEYNNVPFNLENLYLITTKIGARF